MTTSNTPVPARASGEGHGFDGGRLITVTVNRPAHGGVFVGRHEGRVVFVRGAAPGETVTARLLPESKESDRFWRAEAIEVIEASPDRVTSVWPEAGTDGIGGADFAHIQLEAQRRIKTEVLQELLTRAKVGTLDIDEAQVQPAAADSDGLGWRTRLRFAVRDGEVGMRGWRSHSIYQVGDNPLAHPDINSLGIGAWTAPNGVDAIDVAAPSASVPVIILRSERPLTLDELNLPSSADAASVLVARGDETDVLRGSERIEEQVDDERFELGAAGFWQIHVDAPRLLSREVLRGLGNAAGEEVWDLYAGAGLFSRPAARLVGADGSLVSVEGVERASADATGNLRQFPSAETVHADVAEFVRSTTARPDRVIVDPPRVGVGEKTMALIAEKARKTIVYVSCEPSTLVRDLVVAEKCGWKVVEVQAFDLFPHTHHMETVARLEKA